MGLHEKFTKAYHNDFQHVTGWKVGEHVLPHALRIFCSECSRWAVKPVPRGHITCSQTFAEKLFANAGWKVGSKRKHDVCPDCLAREAAAREQRRQAAHQRIVDQLVKDMPELVVFDDAPPEPAVSVALVEPATTPELVSTEGLMVDKKIKIQKAATIEKPSAVRVQLTRLALDELAFLLRSNVERLPEQGGRKMCRYKDDWNDAKILDEVHKVQPTATLWNVRAYRQEVYGVVQAQRHFTVKNASVAQLTDVLRELCARLGEHDLVERLNGATDAIIDDEE